MICLCETFLRCDDDIVLDGYKWIGHNRTALHSKARRGSGGVGVLLKNSFLSNNSIDMIDREHEDILWITVSNNATGVKLCICVAYLPPVGSGRHHEPELFFTRLLVLEKVHTYQNIGTMLLMGDWNARCGIGTDFIENVDDMYEREVIDETLNSSGQLLIDFLIDCNLCMINGRIGRNNFTSVSTKGRAVVDYIVIPYEDLTIVKDFQVHLMTDMTNTIQQQGNTRVPDHSILGIVLDLPIQCAPNYNGIAHDKSIPKCTKYDTSRVPETFLRDDETLAKVQGAIERIELQLKERQDVDGAYAIFTDLLKEEMENKLRKCKPHIDSNNKSRYKPYWTDDLQELWKNVCKKEKIWLSIRGDNVQKKCRRLEYLSTRKCFDKLLRKEKRKYQMNKDDELLNMFNTNRTKELWKEIGKLGMANERKQKIPMEIVSEDGTIINDEKTVLSHWETSYRNLFTPNATCDTTRRYNPDIDRVTIGTSRDLDSLNSPITEVEVKQAVSGLRNKKAAGLDNIPPEVLKNQSCIKLYFTLLLHIVSNILCPHQIGIMDY